MLKQAVAIAAAAAKKKATLSKKADTAAPTPPSKRPRRESEPVTEAPRPQKRVKMLAKKGEREVHLINSQTTEATTSDDLLPAQVTQERATPVDHLSKVPTAPEVVEPAAAPAIPEVVESPVAAPVGETTIPVQLAVAIPGLAAERQSPHHPKRTGVLLEEV